MPYTVSVGTTIGSPARSAAVARSRACASSKATKFVTALDSQIVRAAVMRNKQLVVDDVPDPVPHAGQVLVRTLACGICGSDLHALQHGDLMVEMSQDSASAATDDAA